MTENFSLGLLCSIGMKRFKGGKIKSEELYLDVEKTPNITVLKKISHSTCLRLMLCSVSPRCFFLYLDCVASPSLEGWL